MRNISCSSLLLPSWAFSWWDDRKIPCLPSPKVSAFHRGSSLTTSGARLSRGWIWKGAAGLRAEGWGLGLKDGGFAVVPGW